jgi:hypothetical protein
VLLLALLLGCAGILSADPLPDGLSRFNPAGLAPEWQFQGTAFVALRGTAKTSESIAVIRLRHPGAGYLLTASESEATTAVHNGFVREGIAFQVPAHSDTPVFRFRNPADHGYFYTVDARDPAVSRFIAEGIAFYAVGATVGSTTAAADDGAQTIAVARYRSGRTGRYFFVADRESPYVVGAFYFGAYSRSAVPIVEGTKRLYGRDGDWWGGVKDFYGEEPGVAANNRGWDGDWRDLKPAIGYYDQQSVGTLEQHIRQASDAGLSFFSFYWYWSRAKHGELLPEALASFMHAKNPERLRFNLSLYAHPWSDDDAIGPNDARDVARQLVEYFRSPLYLRLPDGRPVFVIGDYRNFRESNAASCADVECYARALHVFLDTLKDQSIQTLGVAPFIQIQAGTPGWYSQPDADGITCLSPPFAISHATQYPQFSRDIFRQLTNPGKPVSPCMLENFDERPRQDVLIADRSKIQYLVGKTDALFRHNLGIAKQFSDDSFERTRDPSTRIIYLYAWNEWHEGGILEPTAHAGARNLNIVTDVFQLPRSPSRCLDRGGACD